MLIYLLVCRQRRATAKMRFRQLWHFLSQISKLSGHRINSRAKSCTSPRAPVTMQRWLFSPHYTPSPLIQKSCLPREEGGLIYPRHSVAALKTHSCAQLGKTERLFPPLYSVILVCWSCVVRGFLFCALKIAEVCVCVFMNACVGLRCKRLSLSNVNQVF